MISLRYIKNMIPLVLSPYFLAAGAMWGQTIPATTNLLKGSGVANGAVAAVPGLDYLSPSATTQQTLAGQLVLPDVVQGSPVVDARFLGVKCNGVTDDAPAIAAAIAKVGAAGSAARQLKLPSGTCRVNSTIHVTAQHPWALIGDTPTSGVNDFANSTELLFYGGATPLFQYDYNKSASITSISLSNNVVTVTFSALPTAGFGNGTLVNIAGVPAGGNGINFNGQYTTTSVSATTVTYKMTGTNDTSSGGTISSDYSNAEYDGYVNHPTMRFITMVEANPTTTIVNSPCYGSVTKYTPGSIGVQDWRSGNEHFDHVAFAGFDYPFYGVQADLAEFSHISVTASHSGFYLGPRSDQAEFEKMYNGCSDTAVVIDGAQQTVFYNPVTNSSGTGTFPAFDLVQNTSRATNDVKMFNPWFENRGQPEDAWIRVGYGDTGSPVTGVVITDPQFSANIGATVNAIMSVYNADGLRVERPKSGGGNQLAVSNIYKFYGAYAPASVTYEGAYEHPTSALYDTSNSTVPGRIVVGQTVTGDPNRFNLSTADDGTGGALNQFECGANSLACTFRFFRSTNTASAPVIDLFPGNNTSASLITLYPRTGIVKASTFQGALTGVVYGNDSEAYSPSVSFSVLTEASYVKTMTGDLTFALAVGQDGQQKTLMFCQDGVGSHVVTPPPNVHGFFANNAGSVGVLANRCSVQTFRYFVSKSGWYSTGAGQIDE